MQGETSYPRSRSEVCISIFDFFIEVAERNFTIWQRRLPLPVHSGISRAVAMNLADFQRSLGQSSPPAPLSLALQSLWFDAKGDWNKAHELAQQDGESGDWVHAYLHRKEGDASNARYWYIRAGKSVYSGSLEDEWAAISEALLAKR